MNPTLEPLGLHCPDGREPQLLSVQVQAEILGLMLRLTVRQTWRNASGAPMATRLRFPLGWDQTLLDLHMQRGPGSQQLTTVWRESRQCCSATPGVLATGEQVSLQWRIGQLLRLEGSSLRLQLPAGLMPPTPRGGQIKLEVRDPVAQGTVSCTSHHLHKVRHADGVTLSLRTSSGLDKDLVLTVHGLRDTGFALASPNPGEAGSCSVLLSASPRLQDAAATATPLRMKLLVDSSSAMPAERLSGIRAALDKLLAQLLPADQLSYSRFGDHTVHDLPRLQICTEAYQRRVRALARHTDTDQGDPDACAALQAVLAITNEDEEPVANADILLIAASPIWAIEPCLRALRAKGHRLHVMAVGAAGQSLWRELAEASGGACELLGPGQHSQQTLSRLIERMRRQHPVQARLMLQGAQPLCVSEHIHHISDGDTLHLWVRARPEATQQDLAGSPRLHASLHWQAPLLSNTGHALPAAAVLWDEQGDVARLCASRESLLLEDESARQQRLKQHGLIWPDGHRLAASTARPSAADIAPAAAEPVVPAAASAPAVTSATPTHPVAAVTVTAPAEVRPLRQLAPRHLDLAGWLSEPAAPGNPVTRLVHTFNAHAASYTQFRAALSCTLQQLCTRWLDGLVLQQSRRAGNPAKVWALVLHWLHAEHDLALNTQAMHLIELELAQLPVAVRAEVNAALDAAALPTSARPVKAA